MRSFNLAITAIAATLAAGALATSPAAAAASCAGADARPAAGNFDGVRATTLCLVNAERATAGLSALAANPLLTKASDAYADAMVRQRFFDHVSPDGQTLKQRLSAVGYLGGSRDWLAGENIAWGEGSLSTPRQVMAAWMASRGHRENILEPRFREIGLGIAQGSPAGGSGASAATYVTDFGVVDSRDKSTFEPVVETDAAGEVTVDTTSPAPRQRTRAVKRKCRHGRRLVVKRQGKRVVRRCVVKRAKRR
jgi:uncharacterized protein YkwD